MQNLRISNYNLGIVIHFPWDGSSRGRNLFSLTHFLLAEVRAEDEEGRKHSLEYRSEKSTGSPCTKLFQEQEY